MSDTLPNQEGVEEDTPMSEEDSLLDPADLCEDSLLEPADVCEDSLLEPAVELSTEENEGEQVETNFCPFDSLAVEFNEEPEEAEKVQDNEGLSNTETPNESNGMEEAADCASNFSNEIYTPEESTDAIADSTVSESLEDANGLEEDVMIKDEPVDLEDFQKTNLEDFIYSNTSATFDDESNSTEEGSKDELRKSPLYRFPKVVKSVESAEYETLQILYQLLYQRSAWDTHEILKRRILEFTGFSFANTSEEYYNRDMMLKTQPNEVLVKIGQVLCIDLVRNLYSGGDKVRFDLITAIMQFLTVMRYLNRTRKRVVPVEKTAETKSEPNLKSKCGCRNRCLGKTTKIQRRALLHYLKELEEKKLFDSYIFNLMEVRKNERKFNEESKKIREVAYQYKVKMGMKELIVCKGGFAVYHGLKQNRLLQLQNRLKAGTNIPPKIEMNDFPKFVLPETPRKVMPPRSPISMMGLMESNYRSPVKNDLIGANKSEEELKEDIEKQKVIPKIIVEKYNINDVESTKTKIITPKHTVWERINMIKAIDSVKSDEMNCNSASKAFNVPRSTLKRYTLEIGDKTAEEYVDYKLQQRPLSYFVQRGAVPKAQPPNDDKDDPGKDDEENQKSAKAESPVKKKKATSEVMKLREFPLVVRAVDNASTELLIDVHFLLFLNSADEQKVKENILDFTGFDFDSDTEEFDERNEFLQRMSFKIVGDVARSFSLGILGNKEETIKNILDFLTNPDESYLKETSSMPLSLSDVELDDIEGFSDSDESITCEVVEKNFECIDLVDISSGEESDKEGGKVRKTPKKTAANPNVNVVNSSIKQTVTNAKPSILQPAAVQPVTSQPPTTSSAPVSHSTSESGTRSLKNFETICKIVNTHPHEYLVDIYDLLYLKKYEPTTLRKDILDFTGFTFEKGSPDYVKRKQLLDRMLYNSVRRIYNTLIHNTTEVKVFSKPTMITEIFQFLFKLPDHDTSVRPAPSTKAVIKPPFLNTTVKNTPVAAAAVPPTGVPSLPNMTGKLSDLKRVFQRVACFPCEYLIDVHKLLFMTDCDPKIIRQNIFAFKGFSFSADSQEFQQRKMYLEYLTFHSLRKISSVLTTRSVDLRNSTKHELATHLTQVLAEYCNASSETPGPGVQSTTTQNGQTTTTTVTSSSDLTNQAVETIIVTPILDPSFARPPVEPSVSTSTVRSKTTQAIAPKPQVKKTSAITPKSQTKTVPMAISIIDARSISSPAVTTTSNKRKRQNPNTVSKILEKKSQSDANQFADIHLPEIEQYRQLYGQNLSIYNPNLPTITGITTFSATGIPQTFPVAQALPFPIMQPIQVPSSQVIGLPVISQVPSKPTEVIVPGECVGSEEDQMSKKQKVSGPTEIKALTKDGNSVEKTNSFHNKIRDAISNDDDEDCDKPLSSLIGHPIDSVLKKNIVDIVEQTDLQDITINGVIQKIYSMYSKFDLSYRKEFIKSTLRSMLYKLGEQKNPKLRDTDSPDCSVTTTDIQDNSLDDLPETSMECS